LKNKNEFMSFIDSENKGVAKRAHIVVLMSPIPNNDVIVDEANLLHGGDVITTLHLHKIGLA